MGLQELWFVLLAVLFLGFFVLVVNLLIELFSPGSGVGTLMQLYLLILSCGLLLFGAQLLFTGLLAELVVARNGPDRPDGDAGTVEIEQ